MKGKIMSTTKCTTCKGAGWYGSLDVVTAMQGNPPTTCHACNGAGTIPDKRRISEALTTHESRFGTPFELRSVAGQFRISESKTFINAIGDVVLYVERLSDDGQWLDYAKAGIIELRSLSKAIGGPNVAVTLRRERLEH